MPPMTYLKATRPSSIMNNSAPSIPVKFESNSMDNKLYQSLRLPEDHTDYGSFRNSTDIYLTESEDSKEQETVSSFSWAEYCSFFAIGLSMMWTWSMILQAVPYYQRRFESNSWILRYFQSFNLVVFSFTILATTLIMAKSREDAPYERRLRKALLGYILVASLLTASTMGPFIGRPEVYFIFLLLMVFITAAANGLSQNAAFAYAAGFGRTEYAPAIMTGEALAGLLPSTVEILSALLFPSSYFDSNRTGQHQTSILTMAYFDLGILFGIISLCALIFLQNRNRNRNSQFHGPNYNFGTLWRKLAWPASANFLCLCISSAALVFMTKILSVVPEEFAPILLRPEAFIPLAIVLWNIGDLLGSMLAVFSGTLIQIPCLLFLFSLARLGFIPLYLMCNIDGRGSTAGDWFYLILVQFFSGLTHGWLSSTSMSGVPKWVDIEEREAAGAFMGMSLVTGLVAGSLVGLLAAQA